MNIKAITVPDELQPANQPFLYPPNNPDYGIEQDFWNFYQHKLLHKNTSGQIDYYYLPVFWTRYLLNHNFGKTGIHKLRKLIQQCTSDIDRPIFTICQYDNGPQIDLGKTVIFAASASPLNTTPVPLLSAPLPRPLFPPRRRYLASFAGRLNTHPIRQDLAKLTDSQLLILPDSSLEPAQYANIILNSFAVFCPRGYGYGSFRFFESMQLGAVPVLISDQDTRPFPDLIDWDTCSLYSTNVAGAWEALQKIPLSTLQHMGKTARQVWQSKLRYGKWCEQVVIHLKTQLL